MTAQQGLFLAGAAPMHGYINGLDAFGFIAQPPGHHRLKALFSDAPRGRGRPARLPFVVLIVPSDLKLSMRQHLETTYSRARRDLFPDLAGLADSLRGNLVELP